MYSSKHSSPGWARRAGAVASVVVAAVVLAACSSGSSASPGSSGTDSSGSSESSGSAATAGGSVLNLGLIGSVNDQLNPYAAQSTVGEAALNQNMFDLLSYLDNKGNLQMGLATSFTPNADDTVWTVKLRPDVKLHNGGTFGADDVIYSIKQMFEKKATFGAITQISPFVDPDKIKKIDDLTLEFTLKEPYGVFPNAWSYQALPMIGKDSTEAAPDGTGPFTVTSFVPNRQAILKKFDGYWGAQPGFDTLNIFFFQDQQAIVDAMQGGQIDLTTAVPFANVATLKGAGIKFIDSHSVTHLSLDMRTDMPPFNDQRVREALALSIDRDLVVKTAYAGFATVGNDYDAGMQCAAPDVPQRKQDIAKAKQLLAEAGNPKITVDLATDGVYQGMMETGQLVSQDAAEIGITVNLKKMDTGSLLDKWLKWPFVINVMTSDYLSAVPDHLLPGGQDNASHWDNKDFNALATKLFNTPDAAKQCAIVQQMETVQYNDVPSLVVAYQDDLTPYNAKVHGLATDLFNRSAFTFGGVTVG